MVMKSGIVFHRVCIGGQFTIACKMCVVVCYIEKLQCSGRVGRCRRIDRRIGGSFAAAGEQDKAVKYMRYRAKKHEKTRLSPGIETV